MAKPRTSATGKAAEAGYQAPGWPPAMVQPPAALSCPWELMTRNSHVVPAGIPLTCTSSASPHGCGAYLTAATAPVRGLLAWMVVAHGSTAAAGRSTGGERTRGPAPATPPAITHTAPRK